MSQTLKKKTTVATSQKTRQNSLQKALEDTSNQLTSARAAAKQDKQTIAALQSQIQKGQVTRDEEEEEEFEEPEASTRKRRRRKRNLNSKLTDAQTSLIPKISAEGRMIAVTGTPWLSKSLFRVVLPSPEDLEDPEIEVDDTRQSARYIFDSIHPSLSKYWDESFFQTAFLDGISNVKSKFVADIVTYSPDIFEFSSSAFRAKKTRKTLPQVIDSLDSESYLYADGEGRLIDRHLRTDCLRRAARILLHGPSALSDGNRSSYAGSSYAKSWGFNSVTDNFLAFVATGVYFVLTSAEQFSDRSSGIEFSAYYNKRLEMMELQKEMQPASYQALQEYWNEYLFPGEQEEDEDVPKYTAKELAMRQEMGLK